MESGVVDWLIGSRTWYTGGRVRERELYHSSSGATGGSDVMGCSAGVVCSALRGLTCCGCRAAFMSRAL